MISEDGHPVPIQTLPIFQISICPGPGLAEAKCVAAFIHATDDDVFFFFFCFFGSLCFFLSMVPHGLTDRPLFVGAFLQRQKPKKATGESMPLSLCK